MTNLEKFLTCVILGFLFMTCVSFGISQSDRFMASENADLNEQMRVKAASVPRPVSGGCVCLSCGSIVDCERVEKQSHRVYMAKGMKE